MSLSQQMLVAIERVVDDILFFSNTVYWCILHLTQSNDCGAKLSTSFLLSCGPVTAHSHRKYE